MSGKNTSRLCFYGFGGPKRCKRDASERIERPKTLAYYCHDHADVARRIYAGSGR